MTVPDSPPTHPPPELLRLYGVGHVDPATAVSVELHVERCEPCRLALGAAAATTEGPAARLEANWFMIAAELDAPRRGFVERLVTRLGMPVDQARLMAATPSLRRSWFLAVVAAMVFGLVAAGPGRPGSTVALFLALAPLVPVLGVALAYGPGVDPSYEISVAAPISGFRLVLLRAMAVLATSVGIVGLCSLLLAHRHGLVVLAWLVPALALTALCLALTTWFRPKTVAWAVSVGWLSVVLVVSDGAAPDRLVAFGPAAQIGMAVVGLAAAAVTVARRRRFDVVAVRS